MLHFVHLSPLNPYKFDEQNCFVQSFKILSKFKCNFSHIFDPKLLRSFKKKKKKFRHSVTTFFYWLSAPIPLHERKWFEGDGQLPLDSPGPTANDLVKRIGYRTKQKAWLKIALMYLPYDYIILLVIIMLSISFTIDLWMSELACYC